MMHIIVSVYSKENENVEKCANMVFYQLNDNCTHHWCVYTWYL